MVKSYRFSSEGFNEMMADKWTEKFFKRIGGSLGVATVLTLVGRVDILSRLPEFDKVVDGFSKVDLTVIDGFLRLGGL